MIKGNLDLSQLKEFLLRNSACIKKWALPAVVVFALAIFWVFGGSNKEGMEIVEKDQGSSEVITESQGIDIVGEPTEQGTIYVDLGGAVVMPGVYEVTPGTRLFQIIEKAGGLLEDADTDHINQAQVVSDGDKIIIGSRDESSPYYTGQLDVASSEISGHNGKSPVTETEDGLMVDINLADETQLQLIPGVGPSTARKIVEYRDANGKFNKIEDIKNISGIGEKTFENMKDFIIV